MARDFSGNEGYFNDLSHCILKLGAYKATKYISEKLTIKATRKLFKGKVDKRSRIAEIVFTIGAPNYAEREFIKKAKKTNMSFPINEIQMRFPK